MKKFLIAIVAILSIATYIMTSSCNGCSTVGYGQPQYQVMTSPTGQQQVMFYDHGLQYMMEYTMFMSLYNNGGYNNVIHHYHDRGYSYSNYNAVTYSGWKSNSSTTNQSSGQFGNGAVKDGINTKSSDSWKTTSNSLSTPTSDWKTTSNKAPATTTSSSSTWKSTSNSNPSSSSSFGSSKSSPSSSSWSSKGSSSSSSWSSGSRSSSGGRR